MSRMRDALFRIVVTLALATLIGTYVVPPIIVSTVLDRLPAEEFYPPPIYADWWYAVQACSQRRTIVPMPRMYVVHAEDFKLGSLVVIGFYDWWRNRIYLAAPEVFNSTTVGHEMLHALGWFHNSAGYFRCHLT